MRLLCIFVAHKWTHIIDVIGGKNKFGYDVHLGLWQCGRCKKLSEGRCGNGPSEDQTKQKVNT